jgi:hypothetical protein
MRRSVEQALTARFQAAFRTTRMPSGNRSGWTTQTGESLIEPVRLPDPAGPDSLARKERAMLRTLRSLVMALGLTALAVAPVAIGGDQVRGTRVTAVPSATGDISVNYVTDSN